MQSKDAAIRFTASVITGAAIIAVLIGYQISDGAYPLPGVSNDPTTTISTVMWVVAYSVTGLLIIQEQPRQPIGWILLLAGLFGGISESLGVYGTRAVADANVDWPFGLAALAIAGCLWFPSLVLPFAVLPQRYPDGRLIGPRWRVSWWVSVTAITAMTIALGLSPDNVDDWVAGLRLPFAWPEWTRPLGTAMVGYGFLGMILGLLTGLVGLGVRFRNGSDQVRRQIAWLAIPVVLTPVVAFSPTENPPFLGVVAVSIAVAVGIGVLRYDLLGSDVTLRRLLVYLPLTLTVALLIGLSTTWVGRVTSGSGTGALVAAIIVAALILPLRDALRRVVDRTLYGDRGDPLAVLDRFSAGDIEGPSQLVAALAGSLRSPGVALLDSRGAVTAQTGVLSDRAERVDIRGPQGGGGKLLVSPRRGERALERSDRELLASLAPFLLAAVEARQLSVDLERERARVVATAQAERDRLRRDLHDGLGPSLSGIALGAEAAARFLPDDPTAAAQVIDRIRAEAVSATAEVRRVIDDLRPSALETSDLAEAVRQAAQLLPMPVTVECAEGASGLPAAVEDAAFRIAAEALTNVARHSGATWCTVRIDREEDALVLQIGDDGAGFDRADSGVGLQSMRHRAQSLGGSLVVLTRPGGGTEVTARLPLGAGS
jgi:signal transduction histidine kinase